MWFDSRGIAERPLERTGIPECSEANTSVASPLFDSNCTVELVGNSIAEGSSACFAGKPEALKEERSRQRNISERMGKRRDRGNFGRAYRRILVWLEAAA